MLTTRPTPLEMTGTDFKTLGHQLVETIGGFLDSIRDRPVSPAASTAALADKLGRRSLPEQGTGAAGLLARAAPLLFDNSLLNGHPRFFGYITSSPAPIGALADMLAAIVNPNVGAGVLSPIASQIEQQTIRWLCELIGVPVHYGGLLVSGGNMANFTGFLAGMTVRSSESATRLTTRYDERARIVYCPKSTHTWIEKAVGLFGPGKENLRWIEVDENNRMNNSALENAVRTDMEKGLIPMLAVGTAGDVSTGEVDDLQGIGAICKKYGLWFHIDGAYGMPAAVLPELAGVFAGTGEADSIALDPHKWLYCPLEVGCTLVKNPNHLLQTFSSHPVYYDFNNGQEPEAINYYEYGLQNSRGFRALKVWLALQQAGRAGYEQMIREDIALAAYLFSLASAEEELEAVTHSLSITTLRFVPAGFDRDDHAYLNKLNERLRKRLEQEGQVFFSNAVIKEKYCLRACIVNFRTTGQSIRESVELLLACGRSMHRELSDSIDRKQG